MILEKIEIEGKEYYQFKKLDINTMKYTVGDTFNLEKIDEERQKFINENK